MRQKRLYHSNSDDRLTRARCHPDRPHHAHGYCHRCYGTWRYHLTVPKRPRHGRGVRGPSKQMGRIGLGQLPPLALADIPDYYLGMKLYPDIVQKTVTAIPERCPKCEATAIRADERWVSCVMCGGDWLIVRVA